MARILVIDGDEAARAACCESLRRDGHLVDPVPLASALSDAVRREMPDLIVLEVGPPSGGGLGVVGEVLSLGRSIRIVLHTKPMLYADDFRSWLADAYVRKSSDLSELRKAVRDVLDRVSSRGAVEGSRPRTAGSPAPAGQRTPSASPRA